MRALIVLAVLTVYAPAAVALPLCPAPPAKRSDCIHDGDSWWFEGVKFRHSEIDTPEIGHTAACTAEFEIGLKARDRLVELTAGGFSIETTGEKDRYDRVLATIRLPGRGLRQHLPLLVWPAGNGSKGGSYCCG